MLLLNSYQYLFYGNIYDPQGYASHDRIFRLIREVCHGRVIFNNRTEFNRCQRTTKDWARHRGLNNQYSGEIIREAASNYFTVTPRGKVGGYPLWILDVR